jgi:hypothetical protein
MQKLVLLILVGIFAFSCSKSTNSNPTLLWPLKAGDTWVYQDSVFSDSSLTTTYLDTATITTQTTTDPNGVLYYGIHDPAGWFGTGGFVTVGSLNTTIYEWDSLGAAPYIFFQSAPYDGYLVGTGSDMTNPACPMLLAQYGYSTPVMVKGYSCLSNIEYNVDCNNITREAIVTYVSPGVGVVRLEDYSADSTRNFNLYLDYSQTLQSDKLN